MNTVRHSPTLSLSHVRITAGRFRGRSLSFPPLPSLRPTLERVRQNVFDWLSDVIVGARCLDLFAGTGALGFEAVSRGASSVVLVDHHPKVIQALDHNRHRLHCETETSLFLGSARAYIASGPAAPFDLVFLDPPFHPEEVLSYWNQLIDAHALAEQAFLYLEGAKGMINRLQKAWPDGWTLHRHKDAGQVSYAIVRRGKVTA